MEEYSQIKQNIEASIALKQEVLESDVIRKQIHQFAQFVVACFKQDGKVLWCGNGGSAADAQHLAAEFSGRYYYDRPPLFSEALSVNSSYVTAVANDYSYDEIFARLTEAMGRKGDVLIGMSTSGNSGNVVRALERAKERGMITIGLTGEGGGKMASLCDLCIQIPSKDTPRIQECHMLIGHTVCEIVESEIFPK
jgi:D-sedoheptulose 7-phosphate isomerase